MPGPFCRDCHTILNDHAMRCGACGGSRIARHDELHSLTIAHVDCDAFYASIEKRDDPTLRDKAVIIGGGRRGVVATACYNARVHGVHSAQPMWQALKRCPDAVVVRPNMRKYAEAGARVRELMFRLSPAVEPLSIDEAFIDLTGTERLHGRSAAVSLSLFAQQVADEIGITISVGLSYCKYLAKVASDMDKPRGFSLIGRDEAVSVLAPMPVEKIWGVGEVAASKLRRDGVDRIGKLQTMDRRALAERYGSMGDRLYFLSRGIDRRMVKPERERKSVSAETTFNRDRATEAELAPILRRLCEKVSRALKAKEIAGRTVVLKLKTDCFAQLTRQARLDAPTQLADRLYSEGLPMLRQQLDGRRFRLVGIGVSDLHEAELADPPDLVDERRDRNAKAERAVDAIRAKFGEGSIANAGTLDPSENVRDHPYG